MKQRITALLLITLILLTSGCVAEKDYEKAVGTINIVASNFPAYDFAKAVTGDRAEVNMLIKPGSEVHTFEPTPDDIQLINHCDVFIYTGGESDSWLDAVLETVDNPDMQTVRMMDCVEKLEEEYSEGMQVKHHHHSDSMDEHSGKIHHQEEHSTLENKEHTTHLHGYDEHVWTSPANAIEIVKSITDAVIAADPANEDNYVTNSADYLSDLQLLNHDFEDVVKTGKRKTIVFGDRFPLLYFVKEYGLDYYAAYPGCAAESEPNIKTVVFLIEKVKQEEIPAVLHIELSNEKMADTICEATGAQKLMFSSCHNVTAEQFKQGITYIDIMYDNLEALKKALN